MQPSLELCIVMLLTRFGLDLDQGLLHGCVQLRPKARHGVAQRE